MAGPAFRLTKWYGDCVADTGETFIIYSGRLAWRALKVPYQSLLHYRDGESTRTLYALSAPSPGREGTAMAMRSRALQAVGRWQAPDEPLRALVYASELGSVEWRCFQPCGRTEITSAGRGTVAGLGYLERLDLTIPPWALPIERLRWGRFTAPTDSLVWIDWEGPFRTRLAFRQGQPALATRIDEGAVQLASGAGLRFLESLPLRSGPLGQTALAVLAGVSKVVPARILRVEEYKWRSRAVLETPGREPVHGWAIHEVVEWRE